MRWLFASICSGALKETILFNPVQVVWNQFGLCRLFCLFMKNDSKPKTGLIISVHLPALATMAAVAITCTLLHCVVYVMQMLLSVPQQLAKSILQLGVWSSGFPKVKPESWYIYSGGGLTVWCIIRRLPDVNRTSTCNISFLSVLLSRCWLVTMTLLIFITITRFLVFLKVVCGLWASLTQFDTITSARS